MTILDGVLGGIVSAGITSVVSHVIEQHGGVQGLLDRFNQSGLGNVAQSWVGAGANQPITGDQVVQALGSDTIKNLAAKFGIPEEKIAAELAAHLPAAMDKLTPAGAVPAAA